MRMRKERRRRVNWTRSFGVGFEFAFFFYSLRLKSAIVLQVKHFARREGGVTLLIHGDKNSSAEVYLLPLVIGRLGDGASRFGECEETWGVEKGTVAR